MPTKRKVFFLRPSEDGATLGSVVLTQQRRVNETLHMMGVTSSRITDQLQLCQDGEYLHAINAAGHTYDIVDELWELGVETRETVEAHRSMACYDRCRRRVYGTMGMLYELDHAPRGSIAINLLGGLRRTRFPEHFDDLGLVAAHINKINPRIPIDHVGYGVETERSSAVERAFRHERYVPIDTWVPAGPPAAVNLVTIDPDHILKVAANLSDLFHQSYAVGHHLGDHARKWHSATWYIFGGNGWASGYASKVWHLWLDGFFDGLYSRRQSDWAAALCTAHIAPV